MNQGILDLTSLKRATASFQKAIRQYRTDQSNEFVRDSVIQRFEYCYELATKMIKRYLLITSADPSSVNSFSFQELIREAYTKRIIKSSWNRWKFFREDRNKTSHGYNEKNSILIAQSVQAFYAEVFYLLNKLEELNQRL